MSMSRGEYNIELEPGEWFCVVACAEYDYDFKDCTRYGPCDTAEKAVSAMLEWECNPGGGCDVPNAEVTNWHRNLVERARKGNTYSGDGGWGDSYRR